MISVVVPIYNADNYLSECISSILDQSFTDIEVILVNDGSKDCSESICRKFEGQDNRVHVITKSNGGVTSARKCGVEASSGEWICFVDADDTIPVGSIACLWQAVSDETDIVVGRPDNRKLPDKVSLDEYRKNCISGKVFHTGGVARLIRRKLFNNSIFNIPREVIRGEDLIMNVRLAFATEKPPVIVDKCVYFYRPNEASVMHKSIHTIEHAELFHNHLAFSIPKKVLDKYQTAIIQNKIRSIINIIYDNPKNRSWIKTTFYRDLKQQIKLTNYRIPLSDRLFFLVRGKSSLRLVLGYKSIYNRFFL